MCLYVYIIITTSGIVQINIKTIAKSSENKKSHPHGFEEMSSATADMTR